MGTDSDGGDAVMDYYEPIKPVGNDHRVSAISLRSSGVSLHDLQCMQHGVTALRWDAASAHAAPVYLRLENDARTMAWARPQWCAARVGGGGGAGNPAAPVFAGDADPRLSAALAARYQSLLPYRVDEFDDGFIDLMTVKDLSFGTSGIVVDVTAVSRYQTFAAVSKACNCMTLLFGTNMSDNRTVEFVLPDRVARIWRRGLFRLIRAAQRQTRLCADRRVQWLKEQYLQMYFDANQCTGPTPAEAIKV